MNVNLFQGYCKEPLFGGVGDDDEGEGGPQQGDQDAQVHQGTAQQRQSAAQLPTQAGVRRKCIHTYTVLN